MSRRLAALLASGFLSVAVVAAPGPAAVADELAPPVVQIDGTADAGQGVASVEAPSAAAEPDRRRPQASEPIVIGHRGAAGYRPEHTLASYQLAIDQGADYVEPDLVSTRDGVLVARHENEIGATTDVALHGEFADRRTTKFVDGRSLTGWFTEDFTLAELKTLRAKERVPAIRPANTEYDGQFEIPTFDEVLDLVKRASRGRGATIGVYPETKHPSYFDSIGLSLEEPLVRSLRRHGLDRPNAPVFIQSFETANLRELNTTVKVPLVQLVDASGAPYDLEAAGDVRSYRDLITADGLAELATYVDGVGANKEIVLPRDASGRTGEPSAMVGATHAAGLFVHVWTIRNENRFMAVNFRSSSELNALGNSTAEIHAFLDAGVDGVFTDQPGTAVAARDDWLAAVSVG